MPTQLASTKRLATTQAWPTWQAAGLRYYSCNYHLRQLFGRRVQKVSIDAGFTCPNVDGTVATGGCTFCDNRSFSPSRRLPRAGIRGQIDQSIARMRLRYRKCRDYLAYFQPATNTYAPVERLRTVYEEALGHEQVVGLVIGTRPDCVPDEVLDLIAEFAARPARDTVAGVCDPGSETENAGLTETSYRLYVAVEFGMQTMHDRSLDWMNRGHHHDAMIDAVARCRALMKKQVSVSIHNGSQPPASPGVLKERVNGNGSPQGKPPAEPGADGGNADDHPKGHPEGGLATEGSLWSSRDSSLRSASLRMTGSAPFEIGAHVILGLPGESHEDMMATARELGRLGVDAVKIHNLYCVKNTPLADQVLRGEVQLMERAEYVRTLVDFIERLPERMIVDRISGDAPPDYFIGPSWCLDKPAVRTAVLAEFERRGTRQGARAESV